MNSLLRIKNLSKSFFTNKEEHVVLKNISFDVFENEIVALLGPSGCGKSTLLNIISSLDYETNGHFQINGKLGYMFQTDALLENRTVFSNILLSLEVTKTKSEENIKYAQNLCKKYGLSEFLNHYPSEISGGMRQRVSLIRTLVLKPDLLLLDEPFSKLDAQNRIRIQEDVYNIIKAEKKSALIITHDIEEALCMANRILILSSLPTQIKKEVVLQYKSSPLQRRKEPNFQENFAMCFSNLTD